MNALARRTFFILLRMTGVPSLVRAFVQRNKVTVMMYHDLEPAKAERHLRALQRRYNFISLSDYVLARKSGREHELPKRAAILTFDDGRKNNIALLDVVKRLKIPATIFVCSGIVGTRRHFWFLEPMDVERKRELKRVTNHERIEMLAELGFHPEREFDERQALSTDEIARMKGKIDIQAHTIFHPVLPRCADAEAVREITGSKRQLEERYGLEIYAFAYPNGDYSERDVELTKQAGFACAVTTKHGFADGSTDLWRLPRVAISDHGCVSEAIVAASGVWFHLRVPLQRILDRRRSRRDERRRAPRDEGRAVGVLRAHR